MLKQIHVFSPMLAETVNPKFIGSEKALLDLAQTALMELRGKKRIKRSADGDELVETGFAIKGREDCRAVAILHRKTNDVRWIDFSPDNAGAINRMAALLEGDWRFATSAEENAALEQQAKDRAIAQRENDKAIAGPAERAVEKVLGIMQQVAEQKPRVRNATV